MIDNKNIGISNQDSHRNQDNHQNQVTMQYSCLLPRSKNSQEKIVRVRFEQKNDGKMNWAEGIVPDGFIEKAEGFAPEEVNQLEAYLKENGTQIFSLAKEITGITHFFR